VDGLGFAVTNPYRALAGTFLRSWPGVVHTRRSVMASKLASQNGAAALVVVVALLGASLAVACSRSHQTSGEPAPVASSLPAPGASSAVASASAPLHLAASSASVDAGPAWGEQRIYALGIETFIRAVPGRGARAIGYLRVGASLRRSDAPANTESCKGGWYAVEPEGYVCNSDSASLDPDAALLAYARPGPLRGQPLPYQYARVRGKVPHYYARLPSEAEVRRIEGGEAVGYYKASFHAPYPNIELLGDPIDVPPALLKEQRVPRPPGAAPRLRFKFHTGRAEPNTRLALMTWFVHEQRRWAITSQLDLVALDRLRLLEPPKFRGIEIPDSQTLPVAFLRVAAAQGYVFDEHGKLARTEPLRHRQGFHLTGKDKTQGGKKLLETREGIWVPEGLLKIIAARDRAPTFVKQDTLRWIDISIEDQTLVAYRGSKPVYATLVSTGGGGIGDPETTNSTPQGLFAIFSKHVTTKMTGDEIGSEYLIDDVPYVQYFHKGYALHGAFWHDNFGRVQSHGCVNLAPQDAAWLFEFTAPAVPAGWHGKYVKSGGTPVLIRR
jgi:lipoprotein-anchoring transpeptidase ErfK/SrfK